MKKEKNNFARRIFFILIFILIFFSIAFFFLGLFLQESIILKYSPDNLLYPSTIQKIKIFRILLFASDIIFLFAALFMELKRNSVEKFAERKRNLLTNLIILFAVVFIFIILAEITLRVIYYEHTTRNGASPGSVAFNKKYFHLNLDGMRDKEFKLQKPNGIKRIIGLGDSFTAGWGIKNASNLYLKKLENFLNRNEDKFEILNFGVGGYDTNDEIMTLREKAVNYKPDIVIIGYMLNDFMNIDPKIEMNPSYRLSLPIFGFWLRSSSYLYYFLESNLNNILAKTKQEESYEEYIKKVLSSEINKEHNKEYFEAIKQMSLENNFTVIILIFPIFQDFENYQFKGLHDFINKTASEQGFYTIDLWDYYQEYDDNLLIVNKDDGHPNELAHELAAKAIYEFMKMNRIGL